MSVSEEIERLADLHRRGLLSDSEFVAAKDRLLSPTRTENRPVGKARIDLSDGRVLLAAGSFVIAASLFLPWIDLVLFRISGFDLIRLAFGVDRALRNLSGLFEVEAGTGSGIRVTVSIFTLLIFGAISAVLWRNPRVRCVQAFVSATLLTTLAVFATLRAGSGPVEFFGVGAWIFVAGLVIVQSVSAALLVVGSLDFSARDSTPLPARIVKSRRGQQFLALLLAPALLAWASHWFLYPVESSGPVFIEYELSAFSNNGWAPQRPGEIAVRGSGGLQRVPLRGPSSTPSTASTVRIPAGDWKSGSTLSIAYEPSMTESWSRSLDLRGLNQFDEAAQLRFTLPEQPTWRSRFSTQELVVTVRVMENRTQIVVEHDDFGVLESRSLRRVNEPQAIAAEQRRKAEEARIEREVRQSCLALQSEWRSVFTEFNRSEEVLYGQQWGFSAVTRTYREWARRAGNMRNGLVDPYNATAGRIGRNFQAQPVPGSGNRVSQINDRARSRIAEQRRAIDRYLLHWETVQSAARIESSSLWRSREGEISNLRQRARAGASINFGC